MAGLRNWEGFPPQHLQCDSRTSTKHHPLFNLAIIYSFTKVVLTEVTWKQTNKHLSNYLVKLLVFYHFASQLWVRADREDMQHTGFEWHRKPSACSWQLIQVCRNRAQRHMHFCMPNPALAFAIAELPVQTKHFTWANCYLFSLFWMQSCHHYMHKVSMQLLTSRHSTPRGDGVHSPTSRQQSPGISVSGTAQKEA